ncbi:MAG: hypothetical protein ACRAVC_07075 [Trichormus sp.]
MPNAHSRLRTDILAQVHINMQPSLTIAPIYLGEIGKALINGLIGLRIYCSL